jgi:PST family polysaccharide transporter
VSEPAPRGLTRLVVRGVALAGGGYVVTQVLTLAAYLVLARLLAPEEFGDFAAASVLIGVGFMVTESGMLSALVQRPDRIEEAAATAVISTAISGAALSLTALALSPLIGHFFDSDRVGELAAAMAGVLFLYAIPIVPTALLQRRFSFLRRMVVQPVGTIVFGVVAVVCASNGVGVWSLVYGTYAQAIVDVALSWGLARWRPQLRLASFAVWRELIAYGRHVFTATAVLHVGAQIPVALTGRYVGAGALGQYRYADRIASMPFAITLAGASYVVFPAFARIASDAVRLRGAFIRALRWMSALAFPLGLALLPLGQPLTVLVFGPRWEDAGTATMALALYPAAGAVFSVVSEVFTANGRPQLLMRLVLVQLAVGAAAMVALVHLGLTGIAAGVSIGAVGGAAYSLYVVNRELEVPFKAILGELWQPTVAGMIMAAIMVPVEFGVVHAASHPGALGFALLAVESLACAVIYLGVLHRLAPDRLHELRGLLRAGASGEADQTGVSDPIENEMLNEPPALR